MAIRTFGNMQCIRCGTKLFNLPDGAHKGTMVRCVCGTEIGTIGDIEVILRGEAQSSTGKSTCDEAGAVEGWATQEIGISGTDQT